VAWSRRPPAGRSRALRPFPHASPSSRLAGRRPAAAEREKGLRCHRLLNPFAPFVSCRACRLVGFLSRLGGTPTMRVPPPFLPARRASKRRKKKRKKKGGVGVCPPPSSSFPLLFRRYHSHRTRTRRQDQASSHAAICREMTAQGSNKRKEKKRGGVGGLPPTLKLFSPPLPTTRQPSPDRHTKTRHRRTPPYTVT
jgi:hypothetical protein